MSTENTRLQPPAVTAQATSLALHRLTEADALLHEGVRRIMAASSDLPEASHPLEEALRLTETQAMSTLEAVENGFAEIAAIRATQGGFIDAHLDRIEQQFHIILSSQQGQDLAGQRLKKTIHLLQAVEQRIRAAVDQLGPHLEAQTPSGSPTPSASIAPLHGVPAYAGPEFAQDDVDALLRDLGI
ncbi:MAG: chemotaxis protein CheZ [Thiomonas sp. 20-64-5]|nr:MAG: chemotaxis protein CheZ [Thiomonas sp. 20-64-5]